MTLKIDHVTIAGSDLARLQESFSDLGLKSEYGGPHSNGVTHMALLGFEDGSYIELISTLQPGQHAPVWGDAISQNIGPCAWAQAVSDVHAEAQRIASLGVKVIGPQEMDRRCPDGLLVQWYLAFLGNDSPGVTLPFLIEDRTPRDWRVQPNPALAEKGLTGVGLVVLAVKNLGEATGLFKRVYGWSEPSLQEEAGLGAKLAHFPGTPVVLATPSGDGWLRTRLDQFGESPCAFLLRTANLNTATTTFGLIEPGVWFGQNLAWFDPQRINGARLGCVQ